MKISVIIPVYNVEKYLETCVDSVIALKSDIEILLVDDGSKDKSGELCDTLAKKDSRITVIHKENGGLSSARNAGIGKARGEYLLFLDSDDILDSESTDRMLSALTDAPDLLLGLYKNYFTAEGTTENEPSEAFCKMSGLYSMDDFLKSVPAHGETDYITAWRFVVKRSLIEEHSLYFFEGIYHEDEEWTERLFGFAKNVFVAPEYFYLYRQAREGAITATVKPKNIFDRFLILENATKLIEAAENETLRKYLCCRAGQLVLTNMINAHILSGEDKKTALQSLKKHKAYLGYLPSKKAKIISLFAKVSGVKITCTLLGIISKLR